MVVCARKELRQGSHTRTASSLPIELPSPRPAFDRGSSGCRRCQPTPYGREDRNAFVLTAPWVRPARSLESTRSPAQRYCLAVDSERARQLLARERERIEGAIADLRREAPAEADSQVEPGDEGDEGLYQDEFEASRTRDYEEQLAALERAEARLAAGTYGLSISSGDPIPDERLEAFPTAERTVEEERKVRSD